MAQADHGSKWLIGHSPQAWVAWLFDDPTTTVEAQLSTEFQHLTRLSDSLLQINRQGERFLLLTEVQLRADLRMPQRMRAYAALAEEKYHLLVYPVVFCLLPPSAGTVLAERYHSELLGLMAHQDFIVVKAWELEASAVLGQENPALLPFVPLMRGANEAVIRQSAGRLRGLAEGERLEALLGLFASFVLDVETIQQIVRWDMTVLRESPWYQEILQEGLEQGRVEGTLRGRREAILHLLRVRFYLSEEPETELAERLEQVTVPAELQQLVIAAAQAEQLADFIERLDEIAPPPEQA